MPADRIAPEPNSVAAHLYGLDPREFVEARSALVKTARANNDRAAATAISKLRKPTTTGWLLNLLAREAPTEIDAFLELGPLLRRAQQQLSGTELRRLNVQRGHQARDLARRSGSLAAERGRMVNEDALREVTQTLNAALSDDDTADLLRRGTVVTAVSYDGFGPAEFVIPDRHPTSRSSAITEPKASPDTDHRAKLAARLDEAAAALAEAKDALRDAELTRASIDSRIAILRAELDSDERRLRSALATESAAEAAVRGAESHLDLARQLVADPTKSHDWPGPNTR